MISDNNAGSLGGGIFSYDAPVELTNVTLSGNSAVKGGGLASYGTVSFTNSTLSGNTADTDGGGIYASYAKTISLTNVTVMDNTAGAAGGGINGAATITGSTISGNTAGTSGGGVAGATIIDCTITGNTAGGNGGGVYVVDGTVELINTTISHNTCGVEGGGIYNNHSGLTIQGVNLLNNQAPVGGGLFNNFRTTIDDSTISGNRANTGAGIYEQYYLTVSGSTISENVAVEDGGGIVNSGSGLNIADSTFSRNTAGRDGGGLFNDVNKRLTVTGTTFSDNEAASSGGGVFSHTTYRLEFTNSTLSGNLAVQGGGLFTEGNITLTNSTLSDNTATSDGGGIYTSGYLTMANTILAGNTAPTAPDGHNAGTVNSLGHNLIGNDSSFPFTPSPGDLVGTAASHIVPLLAPLADNGGPTLTHALLLGSPAFDAGDNAFATVFDQRGDGFDRIIDGNGDGNETIDIGAFESELLNRASISGAVFVDVNRDGLCDGNEPGVDGVVIELFDESDTLLATTTTSDGGVYLFNDLDPGTYLIHEVQPTGVDHGAEILGSLDGDAIVADDTMQLTLERIDAADYLFAELGQEVTSGDTATIGFWQNKHGQQLIARGGTDLADWLTENLGNVFGDTFADGVDGDDGAEVATFFKDQLFRQKSNKSAGPAKVDAQFMAVALATYFTSSDLAGDVAADYGFNVTDTGIGTKVVNLGANGAAFGTADNTDLTVMQLLAATNNLTDEPYGITGFAHIYDADGNGVIDSTEVALRTMANDVYSAINQQGDV